MEFTIEITKSFENWLESETLPESYLSWYIPEGCTQERECWGREEAMKNYRLARSQLRVPTVHLGDVEKDVPKEVVESKNLRKSYSYRIRLWGTRTEDNRTLRKYWMTSEYEGVPPSQLQEAVRLWIRDTAPTAKAV